MASSLPLAATDASHAAASVASVPGSVRAGLRRHAWLLPAALLLVSFGRTAGLPCEYILTHWLQNYNYGWMKRGLPGALVQPLLPHRDGAEIRLVISYLSILLLAVLVYFLLASLRRLLSEVSGDPNYWIYWGVALLFAGSPFVRVMGCLVGFFDHISVIAALWSIALVRRGYWLATGVIGSVALLCHELYAAVAFPAVGLACWLATGSVTDVRSRRLHRLKALGLPVATGSVVIVASHAVSLDAVARLRDDMRASGASMDSFIDLGTIHLSQPLLMSVGLKSGYALTRIVHGGVWAGLWPFAVALSLGCLWLCWKRQGKRAAVFLGLVILAPMVVLFAAADVGRFSSFVVFGAFAGLLAAVAIPSSKTRGRNAPPWMLLAVVVASVCVVGWKWSAPVYPWGGAIHNGGVLTLRSLPTPGHERCDREIVLDAKFEQGIAGVKPTGRDRSQDASSGVRKLTSEPFRIDGRNMNFRLGGVPDGSKVGIGLFVLGERVHFETPSGNAEGETIMWNVELEPGNEARLVVLDQSPGGHLWVERFCYAD